MSREPNAQTGPGGRGLGREGLESLFPELAKAIDQTPADLRERLLIKAFLLLADKHGDVEAALWSLREAAVSGDVEGRGRQSGGLT